jgi:hypothetical protein
VQLNNRDRKTDSLGLRQPLSQIDLPGHFYGLLYLCSVHSATVFQEFFRDARRKGCDRKKYLHSDQMFKRLGESEKVAENKARDHTVMSTSRLHRTIPMLPPLTWTGADKEART